MTSLPSTSTAEKIHEDENFGRQDILQFFSGVSKDYKYVKSPKTWDRHFFFSFPLVATFFSLFLFVAQRKVRAT